jgi:outer membrane protein assembly factor BamB
MKRINLVVLILCAGFVSVAWGQPTACKVHTPWAEFHRHNMRRSNPCEKVLNVHNVENLALKWSYATGGPVDSDPAAANDLVYVSSDDGNVYALKASDGTNLWSYKIGGPSEMDSSPAVAEGVVYVGSYDGNAYAFGLK